MDLKASQWRPGQNVCRCCLTEGCYKDISSEYFWMGKREVYTEMLSDCFGVTICQTPPISSTSVSRLICDDCVSRLRDASNFKRQVLDCEKMFKQYLEPAVDETGIEISADLLKVKRESVKTEIDEADDSLDQNVEYLEDDAFDDLDDEPLTKLASKTKKESVDIMDLLDNEKFSKAPEPKAAIKRKSTIIVKATPPKKSKPQKVVKAAEPTTSSSIKDDKKKGDEERRTKINNEVDSSQLQTKSIKIEFSNEYAATESYRRNITVILECSTAKPFKWRRGSYLCFFCNTTFVDPENLRKHTYKQHKTKNNKFKLKKNEIVKLDFYNSACTICSANINDFDTLKSHLAKHNKELENTYGYGILPYSLNGINFKCLICNENFSSYLGLNNHMNDHYKHFICETCGKGFALAQRMISHMRSHERGAFDCKSCGETFVTLQARYAHVVRVHRDNKRYKCQNCDEKFVSYTFRLKHMRSVHGIKTAEFPCPSCPQVFQLRSRRTFHIKVHHLKVRNHECSVCGMLFFRKFELNQHMIRHGGERLYQCDICKRSYARIKTLKEHMRIHNNDRRFVCPICGQAFVQKCSMKQHIKVHHPN